MEGRVGGGGDYLGEDDLELAVPEAVGGEEDGVCGGGGEAVAAEEGGAGGGHGVGFWETTGRSQKRRVLVLSRSRTGPAQAR
jgi:hypothetical protein